MRRAAAADAAAVLAGVSDEWRYQLEYSSSTLSNYMASEINSRGEQQFDTLSIISVSSAAPKAILGVKLQDPIDNVADPRIVTFMEEWKDNTNIAVAGPVYSALTLTSAKHMHLILAEDALAQGNTADFETHINAVRAVDGLSNYTGQIPAMDMLKHERRTALFVTGVRLLDMYRFGIVGSALAPGFRRGQESGDPVADHVHRGERQPEHSRLLNRWVVGYHGLTQGRGPWPGHGPRRTESTQ
jgi:starch-binding outer membrane protein, SusD/RagB family